MDLTLKLPLTVLLVLAIMYVVPFLVYGPLSALGVVKMPEGVSPAEFMLAVLVIKIGVALTFVLIIVYAGDALAGRWLLYAVLWWLLFAFGEVGQAIGPNYTWPDALAGVLSETIYCPLSAWAAFGLLGAR